MVFNVVFSDAAEETFNLIGEQLRERFGEREVFEFRRRVYAVVDIIAISPLIFKAAVGNENLRKAFIHKNCSMLYKVGSTHIDILFFWDNRQDPIFET